MVRWFGTVAQLALLMVLAGDNGGEEFDHARALAVCEEFVHHYDGWMAFQESRPKSLRSDQFPMEIFENEHYQALLALGPEGIPFFMAWYNADPFLGELVYDTCGLRFRGVEIENPFDRRGLYHLEEFPDTLHFGSAFQGVPLLSWWRGRKSLADRWFLERWNQYVAYKQQGEDDLAAERLERIGEIGIDALPFLIRLISSGHEELIPIASNVSKRPWASESITLPENATKEQCEAWWNRYQADYTIPDYNPLDLLRECMKNRNKWNECGQ